MINDLRDKEKEQSLSICKRTERRYEMNLNIKMSLGKVFHLASGLINENGLKFQRASLAVCDKFAILITISIFAFLLLPFGKALAQTPQSGITVTPSIIHLDLASDAPEYSLTYLNTTKADINLLLSVSDFTQLEEGYKISFLTGKDAQNYKYSLSSWISFENKNIQLAPGEKKAVKVYIDKKRITKGGHYATILAEIIQPNTEKQVALKAVLSSLLFVRASTGLEIEEGKISSLKPVRNGIEYPEGYSLRFENSGNVHVIPYGLIQIYDPLGNFVAKGILNEGSLDALPESIRRYDIKVQTYQKVLLPGFYTAKMSMRFGKTNQKLSSEVKFFSQGSFDFIKIGMGLLLIILALSIRKRKHDIRKS